MGNTGAEIALDLVEQGAHPTISVRNGVHIVPRELFGIPIQMFSILSGILPLGGNSPAAAAHRGSRAWATCRAYGITRPPGPIMQKSGGRARIPRHRCRHGQKNPGNAPSRSRPASPRSPPPAPCSPTASKGRFDVDHLRDRISRELFKLSWRHTKTTARSAIRPVNDLSRSFGSLFRRAAEFRLGAIARYCAARRCTIADDIAQRQPAKRRNS